jgi:hypothetical protein
MITSAIFEMSLCRMIFWHADTIAMTGGKTTQNARNITKTLSVGGSGIIFKLGRIF